MSPFNPLLMAGMKSIPTTAPRGEWAPNTDQKTTTGGAAYEIPNYEKLQAGYAGAMGGAQRQANDWQAHYTPMMHGALGAGDDGGMRQQQGALAQMLLGQLGQGEGPSAAQAQLQMGTDANIRNAMAMGQSMPGGANANAYRNILMNQAQAQQQGAGQAAMLRSQESQFADQMRQGTQGLLGNILSGARGQDQSMFQARNQAAQGWGQMGLQQQQIGNQAALGYGQLLNQNGLGQLQGQIERQRIISGIRERQANTLTNGIGGLANAAGAAFGAGGMFSSGGAFGGGGGPMGPSSGASMGVPIGAASGGMVPGQASGGDRSSNDTVPAMLSPGEIVLPRSVVNDEDAEAKAAEFVKAIKARNAANRMGNKSKQSV